MNPELQKQLADMLAKLTSATEQGAKWTATQIPPLIHEKIVVGRVEETVYCVLGVALVTLALPRLIRALFTNVESAQAANYDHDGPFIVRAIIAGIASIITTVFGCSMALGEFHNLVLVWFAPRLYIVEWLRGMVTK